MQNTTTLLLKHGIQGLISENEEFFKKNITQALALKLHDSVAEIKNDVAKSLLEKQYITKPSTEIMEFVEFLSKFKGGTYKFKNGSSINITESEIQLLKQLFESLNPDNRQKMVSEILVDGAAFKQHIEFSQKAKRLI